MKKIRRINVIIIFLLGIISIFLFIPKNYSKAYDNGELFFQIINKTNSNIVEAGFNVSFPIESYDLQTMKEIFSYLELSENCNKKVIVKDNNYDVYFCNKNIKGNINMIRQCGESIVIINCTSNQLNKDFINLKNRTKSYLKLKNKKDYVYEYLKAESQCKNVKKINEDIKLILNDSKAKNIETIKLNNGYSTTAYTRKYTPINVFGKYIDFNYAVCSYNSTKTYIIIGTPQINITY